MLLGYNTNGFAHHRLADALTVLAQLGYGSVAITLEIYSHVLPDMQQDAAAAMERFVSPDSQKSV